MLEFFKSLNRTERLTLLACFLGWALDAMDANAATMLVPTLSKIFGVGTSEIGLMITATLIGTGIGGWLAGAASDRFGRVVTLQVTIAWFSIGSLVCGLAQTFPQLVVARVIQGIGFGGEWAVGAVLIAEIVKPQWRATALGIVQSGFSVGMAAAAAVYFAMFSLFPDDLAWRMVFIAGCLPALLIIFIRQAIVEPSTSATARAAGPVPGSLWRIFGPRYRRMTLLGSALCLALQGASAAIALWLPTLLTMHQKMSVGGMSAFFALQSVGAFIGYLAAARTADLIGRRRCLWLFMAAAAAIAALLCFARLGQTGSLVLALPLGIFAFGLYSNFGPVLSELFPHSVRGSGQGFCYNFGRGVGAVFPALVGLMAEGSGLAWAMGVVALSGYAAGGLIVLLLPETRGKILEDDAAEAAATDPAWTQHVHSH